MTEKIELIALKALNKALKAAKTIRRGSLYDDLPVIAAMAVAALAVGNMMSTLIALAK